MTHRKGILTEFYRFCNGICQRLEGTGSKILIVHCGTVKVDELVQKNQLSPDDPKLSRKYLKIVLSGLHNIA